jgi:hypothetical protein
MTISKLRAAVLVAAISFGASVAHADVLLNTASNGGMENNDYLFDNSNFLAVAFNLNQAENITDVGGYFSQYSDGNPVFVVITTSLTNWSNNSVAQTLFTPIADGVSDTTVPLATTLSAGSYYVVVGSGAFGASGSGGLVSGQNPVGNASFFQSFDAGSTWVALSDNSMRVFVDGTAAAVPVPAAMPLLASGLAFFAAAARRRAK